MQGRLYSDAYTSDLFTDDDEPVRARRGIQMVQMAALTPLKIAMMTTLAGERVT